MSRALAKPINSSRGDGFRGENRTRSDSRRSTHPTSDRFHGIARLVHVSEIEPRITQPSVDKGGAIRPDAPGSAPSVHCVETVIFAADRTNGLVELVKFSLQKLIDE
jgi:hypothetical protein